MILMGSNTESKITENTFLVEKKMFTFHKAWSRTSCSENIYDFTGKKFSLQQPEFTNMISVACLRVMYMYAVVDGAILFH